MSYRHHFRSETLFEPVTGFGQTLDSRYGSVTLQDGTKHSPEPATAQDLIMAEAFGGYVKFGVRKSFRAVSPNACFFRELYSVRVVEVFGFGTDAAKVDVFFGS